MLRKIVQPFYAFYAAITFALCFMFAFPFMVLSGSGVTARKKIVKIARYCYRFWLMIIGMPLELIGEKPSGRYIFVANHTSYIDTVIIFPAIRDHFRTLGKTRMDKIPFYGYFYKRAGILVDRKSAKSRTKSMWLMARHVKTEGSLIIFPEGTFNETPKPLKEFFNGAFHLAITTQTPIFPMIFPDAVNRWHYSAWWKLWPGRNRVVYLGPIPTAGLTLGDLPALRQHIYTLMENALIRYKTIK